jgi:hypothetical protein
MSKLKESEANADAGNGQRMLTRIIVAIGVGVVVAALVYLVTKSWPAALGGAIASVISEGLWKNNGDPWQSPSGATKLFNISVIGMAVSLVGILIVNERTITLALFGVFFASLVVAMAIATIKMILWLRQIIWRT